MDVTDLVFIDSTGYHFADYPTFLAYYQNAYKGLYGADVYLEADSQDGQWLAIQAKAAYDTAALGAATYNSQSPVTAQGVGLSRIVKVNGISRQSPSFSTATLSIGGQANTVITNGVAIDSLQQKWNLPANVTIPGAGTIDVTATAQVVGDIEAEIGSINKIFTPTLGWQTVTNAGAAIPGAPVESDAELRVRQQQSTADPSLTVFDGTIGGVENLTGVTKVRGYENDTNATDANGIPPHSICVVVAGGDDMAVAQEIALHKTPGTGTYGTTSEVVYDSHGMPLNIHFDRPVIVTIGVQITVATTQGWSDDFVLDIQNAVAAVINANKIGDPVLITKLYGPAYLTGTAAGQTFDIASLEIKKNAGAFGTVNIDLAFNEDAVCNPTTNVVVNIT